MTVGASSTAGAHAYGDPAYWDQRYRQDPGPFDWYQKYKTLAPLLDLYLRRSHRLLLVGCGNSELGEHMIADGYQDVVNIDISSVVVEAMQKKYQDKPQLKYIKMDVRDMNSFEDGSFDAIIDKGTLDSLMGGWSDMEGSIWCWNLRLFHYTEKRLILDSLICSVDKMRNIMQPKCWRRLAGSSRIKEFIS